MHAFTGVMSALRSAHSPQSEEDLLPSAPARARIAYDELLAGQVVLARRRRAVRGRIGGAPLVPLLQVSLCI